MSFNAAQAMHATSEAFLAAFEVWKTKSISALRAPECEHVMLPPSLNRPKRSNTEFGAYLKSVECAVRDVKMERLDYFASIEDRRAWFHATLVATAVDGQPYDNEYMLVLSFDGEGRKVTMVLEKLDSIKTTAIYTRLAVARGTGLNR